MKKISVILVVLVLLLTTVVPVSAAKQKSNIFLLWNVDAETRIIEVCRHDFWGETCIYLYVAEDAIISGVLGKVELEDLPTGVPVPVFYEMEDGAITHLYILGF